MNWLTAKTTLHGVEVAFFFPVSKIERSLVFQKMEEALGTIEAYAPVRFTALRTDLRQILIRGLPDEVSHYDPERQLCEIFVGWIKSDEGTPEAIASTVVHEAEHARLWRLGFRYTPEVQARIERICHRAERVFCRRLPTGAALVAAAQLGMDVQPQFYAAEARLHREREALRRFVSGNPLVVPMLWVYDFRAWLRKRREAAHSGRVALRVLRPAWPALLDHTPDPVPEMAREGQKGHLGPGARGDQENGIHEVTGSIPVSSTNSSNNLAGRRIR